MALSAARLATMAEETGFRAETLERVIRLGEILTEIGRHPFLSRVLALKGGTDLNLCFGSPSRLSVDLDLNYIGRLERDGMIEDRDEIQAVIQRLASALGYRLQWSRNEHAGRKAFLGFVGAAGTPGRIEVDLNFLFRLPLGQVRRMTMWQPADQPRPAVKVVSPEELASGNLCALLSRALPRDLFDARALPEKMPGVWGELRFRRLFVAFAGVLDHPLHAYGRSRFDRVTDRAVREQLHPMLLQHDRPAAAGLREDAWAVIAPLLDLDDAAREYTDRLQAGELHPQLLFPDDADLASQVARHPALLWKAQNAREHAAKGARPGPKRSSTSS